MGPRSKVFSTIILSVLVCGFGGGAKALGGIPATVTVGQGQGAMNSAGVGFGKFEGVQILTLNIEISAARAAAGDRIEQSECYDRSGMLLWVPTYPGLPAGMPPTSAINPTKAAVHVWENLGVGPEFAYDNRSHAARFRGNLLLMNLPGAGSGIAASQPTGSKKPDFDIAACDIDLDCDSDNGGRPDNYGGDATHRPPSTDQSYAALEDAAEDVEPSTGSGSPGGMLLAKNGQWTHLRLTLNAFKPGKVVISVSAPNVVRVSDASGTPLDLPWTSPKLGEGPQSISLRMQAHDSASVNDSVRITATFTPDDNVGVAEDRVRVTIVEGMAIGLAINGSMSTTDDYVQKTVDPDASTTMLVELLPPTCGDGLTNPLAHFHVTLTDAGGLGKVKFAGEDSCVVDIGWLPVAGGGALWCGETPVVLTGDVVGSTEIKGAIVAHQVDQTPHPNPPTPAEVVQTAMVFQADLVPCDENWLPKGGSEDNSVNMSVALSPAGLNAAVEFSLADVSRLPGYCMNAPLTVPLEGEDSASWNDLQFASPQEGFAIAGTQRSIATSTVAANQYTVRVNCYDYGAYGKLKAKVTLGGRTFNAYVMDTPKTTVSLPKDDNNNQIADKATGQDSGPGPTSRPADDRDCDPSGDTTDGDVLTRYEEYRGFMCLTGHARTSAAKKTVFIRNLTGRANALARFASASGLEIIEIGQGHATPDKPGYNDFPREYTEAQWNGTIAPSRVINANGGARPQRAIYVEAWVLADVYGAWTGAPPPRPSTTVRCRVDVEKIHHTLALARTARRTDTLVAYLTTSLLDRERCKSWMEPGRISIGDNAISFVKHSGPDESTRADDGTQTSGVHVEAAGTTIVLSKLGNLSNSYVLIVGEGGVNEVVKLGEGMNGVTGFKGAALDGQQGTNRVPFDSEDSYGAPVPPAGTYLYACLDDGAKEEWVTYTGVEQKAGRQAQVALTGVTRGQGAQPHDAHYKIFFPRQYAGCVREAGAVAIPPGCSVVSVGVFTGCAGIAEDHPAGAAQPGICKYGVAADSMMQGIVAHELGHAVGITLHYDKCIMADDGWLGGVYLNSGIWETYCNAAKAKITAK